VTQKTVIRILNAEGLEVKGPAIGYAAMKGAISKTVVDGAGNRQFTAKHVAELRAYFSVPHPRGRKVSVAP
jgi:hypothetical protein